MKICSQWARPCISLYNGNQPEQREINPMGIIETIARFLRPILESAPVKRVRRNHGLEHATIHMLNRQRYNLSGRAGAGGFLIFGDVPTDKVERAARDALSRLRNGQSDLAIHPNCGTNLVTSGLLTTSVAALGFAGTNRKRAWERFPIVLVIMMITVLYSQPIGMVVQKHITTSGEPGELDIIEVTKSKMSLPFRNQPMIVHNISTR